MLEILHFMSPVILSTSLGDGHYSLSRDLEHNDHTSEPQTLICIQSCLIPKSLCFTSKLHLLQHYSTLKQLPHRVKHCMTLYILSSYSENYPLMSRVPTWKTLLSVRSFCPFHQAAATLPTRAVSNILEMCIVFFLRGSLCNLCVSRDV